MDFEPRTAELIQSGATAALILDAMAEMSSLCVEQVLKTIDHHAINGTMTPEIALQLVSELSAYRRIVMRTRHKAELGARAKEKTQ